MAVHMFLYCSWDGYNKHRCTGKSVEIVVQDSRDRHQPVEKQQDNSHDQESHWDEFMINLNSFIKCWLIHKTQPSGRGASCCQNKIFIVPRYETCLLSQTTNKLLASDHIVQSCEALNPKNKEKMFEMCHKCFLITIKR